MLLRFVSLSLAVAQLSATDGQATFRASYTISSPTPAAAAAFSLPPATPYSGSSSVITSSSIPLTGSSLSASGSTSGSALLPPRASVPYGPLVSSTASITPYGPVGAAASTPITTTAFTTTSAPLMPYKPLAASTPLVASAVTTSAPMMPYKPTAHTAPLVYTAATTTTTATTPYVASSVLTTPYTPALPYTPATSTHIAPGRALSTSSSPEVVDKTVSTITIACTKPVVVAAPVVTVPAPVVVTSTPVVKSVVETAPVVVQPAPVVRPAIKPRPAPVRGCHFNQNLEWFRCRYPSKGSGGDSLDPFLALSVLNMAINNGRKGSMEG